MYLLVGIGGTDRSQFLRQLELFYFRIAPKPYDFTRIHMFYLLQCIVYNT